MDKIYSTAEKLGAIRKAIGNLEDETAIKMSALKQTRDELQSELLTTFEKEGLGSVKTATGETYSRSVRSGIEILDNIQAMRWAMANHAVTVSKILVTQKLKDSKEMPPGFERTETAFISVRSAKKKDAGEENQG